MPDLYGKLNKEVRIYNYEGVETDTAKVTVDNKTQDISVDVKRVPNELTLTTINGDTYTYDGSEPASFDIRTQVTDKVEEGNNLPVTSDAVKGYVDSKAGALEYVGGEGNFTNIAGGVTVKGRLNVDDGIYSPVTSDDPNFVPNNKTVDDKVTASEQKLIDERIGAFTRTADKLFTDVTGGMTIKGHLNVDSGITSASAPADDTDVTNKGYVDDLCDTKLDKTGGTLTGDLIVEQNLIVKGTTTTVDTENLEVKDSLITVAKGNTAPLTSPAGIHVPKYDGTSDGALVFDASGTAYVGDVKLDESGNINTSQSDLQPIATRKGLSDGNLVKWDETNNTLVDSGKAVDDFVPIHNTGAPYTVYATTQSVGKIVQTNLSFSQAPIGNTIVQRSADGVVRAGTPVGDNDATTKKYVDDGFVAKQIPATTKSAYTTDTNGEQSLMAIHGGSAEPFSIVARSAGGVVRVGTPVGDNDATTKKYVDDGFVKSVAGTTNAPVVYIRGQDGTDKTTSLDSLTASAYSVAQRDVNGNIKVGTPVGVNDATTKKYVDDGFVAKRTTTSGIRLYAYDSTGDVSETADAGTTAYTIARRDGKGHVRTATPIDSTDATNKDYVDNGFVAKITSTGSTRAYTVGTNGEQSVIEVTANAAGSSIAKRTVYGSLRSITDGDNNGYALINRLFAENNLLSKKPSNFDTSSESNAVGVYTFDYNGTNKTITPKYMELGVGSGYIPAYNTDNTLTVIATGPAGVESGNAVPDTYVNTHFVMSELNHTPSQSAQALLARGITNFVYSTDWDNQENISVGLSSDSEASTIPLRDSNGRFKVGTPTDDTHATNKKYVDSFQTITILGADE